MSWDGAGAVSTSCGKGLLWVGPGRRAPLSGCQLRAQAASDWEEGDLHGVF